jgi:phospholipid N-methyltransferase
MNSSLYTRPNKPMFKAITKREREPERAPVSLPEVIAVDRFTECHVTPANVAARMVEYLGPLDGCQVLEPEAGTGNLVQALVNAGLSPHSLTAIERHHSLCSALSARFRNCDGFEPLQCCFLDYAEEFSNSVAFSRILMNPPFKQVRQHMAAALALLGRADARLVALVPVTYEHPEAEEIERLDNDTFASAKVFTKIIRIVR